MAKQTWTSVDICKLFWMEKTKQALLTAEAKGIIPKAERIKRGNVAVRQWYTSQLPEIGKYAGFLSEPEIQQVMCVYIPKGGVWKTTFSYNLARILALNGIKTIIIGLDFQKNITKYVIPEKEITSYSDLSKTQRLGLYNHFVEKIPLNSIIKKTDLPTLDIIPETDSLNFFDVWLFNEDKREYFFKDKLIPFLSDYKAVVFDGNPGWSQLAKNAITASNVIISPLGCDAEAYSSVVTNLQWVDEFIKKMELNAKPYLIPTQLTNNSISSMIYGEYLKMYGDRLIPYPLHSTVKAQEARFEECSIFEYMPTSELTKDYYQLIKELWARING